MSNNVDHFTSVQFSRFKAFKAFDLKLKRVNLLVGPNNAGKSTVLVAFRILAAGLRRATTRRAEIVQGIGGPALGHKVDLSTMSVAEENLFYNYIEDEPAWIKFNLASGNSLLLYFPESAVCNLIPDTNKRLDASPAAFRKIFRSPLGFVPILGPVEHRERLYEKEAARLALSNYGAARNFRNIWYHFPDEFNAFRELIKQTWPGMDINRPEADMSHEKPMLHMWCPEDRVPREFFGLDLVFKSGLKC